MDCVNGEFCSGLVASGESPIDVTNWRRCVANYMACEREFEGGVGSSHNGAGGSGSGGGVGRRGGGIGGDADGLESRGAGSGAGADGEDREDVYIFGVYLGGSTRQLAGIFPGQRIWGFDSFNGLPGN